MSEHNFEHYSREQLIEIMLSLKSDSKDMQAMYEEQRLQYIMLAEEFSIHTEDEGYDVTSSMSSIQSQTALLTPQDISTMLKPQQP
jgi:hypothetical protein